MRCPHCNGDWVKAEVDRGLDVLHCLMCGWMVYDRTPIEEEDARIRASLTKPRKRTSWHYLTDEVLAMRRRFGAVCRQAMRAKGMSVPQVAEASGIPCKSIHKVLQGAMGITTMERLGRYLEVWHLYRTYPSEKCLAVVWDLDYDPEAHPENPLEGPKVGVVGSF